MDFLVLVFDGIESDEMSYALLEGGVPDVQTEVE